MLEAKKTEASPAAHAVIGLPAGQDRALTSESARAIQEALRSAYPGSTALAVVLSEDAEGAVPPGTPLAVPEPGAPAPAVQTGAHGPEAALHTLLDVAVAAGAPACALLEPGPSQADPERLRSLLDPVLNEEVDLVTPSYARRRFEGVLVTGIVYPLTRALFGQRIHQPLGREIVLSRRLAEHLARDDEWRLDPAYAGSDLWVITKALVREARCAQVFLAERPAPRLPTPDVSDALVGILGPLFHEMERNASRWQRVRGSVPVLSRGDEHLTGEPVAPPAPGALVSAFALGWQDLRRFWSSILPPQTLYALHRIPQDPPEKFLMPDPVWARIVYDFAVAWYVKSMDRVQLIRTLTPIYLGWVASFVNGAVSLDDAAADDRIERLCAAFEAEKPYLISRWRWPDRFAP